MTFDQAHKDLIAEHARGRGCNEQEVRAFVAFCEMRQISPVLNQVWVCERKSDGKIMRRPECTIDALRLAANGDTPEIAAIHHRHLVKWMLHRAYERPDSETRDPDKSARAEKEFTKVFGRRPDADLRRAQQANRPQFNKAVW